mgnify:CR=1 FL=1
MNRFPIWKGKRIGRYDDRLILRSVIFFALTVAALSAFVIRLTERNILFRIFLLFLITVLCLLDLFYKWKSGSMVDIRNRQAMSRMLLENRWFETEPLQQSRTGGRMERITYFPALYYRRKKRHIYVTVKISMGKYQDKLLTLEEKLETGLNCELVKKDTKDIWVRYEFLTGVEKSRIGIQDVKAENGELNLMQHISWKYDKLPHMLISGDTGSGKTIFLLIVIKALLESGAVLHICDPKKADLSFLSRIMPDVHYSTESIMECVETFYEGMEARYDEMQEHPDFRMGANYAKVGLTPHFLIFDEYVAFFEMLGTKESVSLLSQLKKIVMLGRQAGYFLIVACQRPDAKYFSDGIRDNFNFRVGLGRISELGYGMLFGSDVKKQFFQKRIKGRGYCDVGTSVISEFYTPLVPKGHDFLQTIGRLAQERQVMPEQQEKE